MSDHEPKADKNLSLVPTRTTGIRSNKFDISVNREDKVVCINFKTANDYVAIELYELIIQAVQKGRLHFDFGAAGPSPP